MPYTQELEFTKKLIKEAGKLVMYLKNEAKSSFKGDSDIVTEADLKSEKFIVDAIQKAFPNDQIMAEEDYSDTKITDERIWVIDPIDGTINYSRKIPLYCISIALVGNSIPQVGCIYIPEFNELYWAEKGKGTFLNDQPIKTSEVVELNKSLIYFGDFHSSPEGEAVKMREKHVIKSGQDAMRTRILGSAGIETAYVAAGKIEALVCDAFYWDVAAGIILVEEAGGKVSKKDGSSFDPAKRDIVLSNGKIHEKLIAILNDQ